MTAQEAKDEVMRMLFLDLEGQQIRDGGAVVTVLGYSFFATFSVSSPGLYAIVESVSPSIKSKYMVPIENIVSVLSAQAARIDTF
jgi:hypothetical protein